MRLVPITLLLLVPTPALAQVGGEPPSREVTLTSDAEERFAAPSRFALTVALGPGVSRAGFSAAASSLGLSGAVSVASVRASVRLTSWIAVQLGAAGALAIAPSTSASAASQRFELQNLSGFGLLGGGLVIGRRGDGVRVSLLGGVAWLWAPLIGSATARTGASPGGGGVVEVAYHWAVGDHLALGLGATGWALSGRDGSGWLDGAVGVVDWNVLGGGLVAAVSTR